MKFKIVQQVSHKDAGREIGAKVADMASIHLVEKDLAGKKIRTATIAVRGGYVDVPAGLVEAAVKQFGGRLIELPAGDYAQAVAEWAKGNPKAAAVANAIDGAKPADPKGDDKKPDDKK